MPRFFTFEEFRDQIIKPDFDKGNIECDEGITLDQIAEVALILFVHDGRLLKQESGGNAVYVSTNKPLPKVTKF